ncbi:vesicle-associated membrane protein 2-like [Lucilia sericata]|uniref:vesicle-associated membrane protein 2-like n=1 Tax=Lucilia sericata TaxID=13632 RepID=UPI0018A85939|nr:vesicle-associated membrane protein 2-like [Lucilia sericata]
MADGNQYFPKGIHENQSFQEVRAANENGVYENQNYPQPKPNQQEPPQNAIQQTQKQVKELVVILQENVDLAMKREDNLNDLTKISKDLEMNAGQFKTTTDIVKRKVWWKQMKTKLVFGGLVVILLLILIFS